MSTTLKVIKSKEFEYDKVKHTHYVTAYKGRVITVSTFNIPVEELEYDGKALTLKVKCDVDLVNRKYHDPITNESLNGLVLMPKLDLVISEF